MRARRPRAENNVPCFIQEIIRSGMSKVDAEQRFADAACEIKVLRRALPGWDIGTVTDP